MDTIGQRLDRDKQVGKGFHTLRWVLALLVIVIHTLPVTNGDDGIARFTGTLIGRNAVFVLALFFGIGGFLVMASASRAASLRTFLTMRFLRLAPALVVETVITVLCIGPLVTRLPVSDYFGNASTYTYFTSLFGRVQIGLPGVFDTNPWDVVNISLWMIPAEIFIYLTIGLVYYSGLLRKRSTLITLLVFATACNVIVDFMYPRSPEAMPTRILVMAAVAGMGFYVWRHQVPLSRIGFFAAALIALLGTRYVQLDTLIMPAVAYCAIFLGLSDLRLAIPVLSTADLSYGLYLYGCPIQQLMQYLTPDNRSWWLNALLAIPVTLCVACVSWYFIERPALALKRRLNAKRAAPPASPPIAFAVIFAMVAYATYMCSTSHIIPGLALSSVLAEPIKAVAIGGAVLMVTSLFWRVRLAPEEHADAVFLQRHPGRTRSSPAR